MTEEIKSEKLDLLELLPNMIQYRGKSVVIKYGGNAMTDENTQRSVVKDIVFLSLIGIRPIIVHGGGPAISEHMKRVDLEPVFVQGQRKTNRETLEIVEMVLCGKVNNQLVKLINIEGVKAVGLSGKDVGLIRAKKHIRTVMKNGKSSKVDMGQVGEVVSIDADIFHLLSDNNIIPVIAPIGVGKDNKDYNINADLLAGEVAEEINAEVVIYLTDVDGILEDENDKESIIREIAPEQAEKMLNRKIKGGMIPKVESCISAIREGVESGLIINGTEQHSILKALLTEKGRGTTVRNKKK